MYNINEQQMGLQSDRRLETQSVYQARDIGFNLMTINEGPINTNVAYTEGKIYKLLQIP